MKKWTLVVGVALFALLQIAGGFCANPRYLFNDDSFGHDLRLRRNEIRCAHQGVNSFRIWNRETALPGFVPLKRPDKADVPRGPGDAVVHAYPPWHTTMFWFYGWLPETFCVSLMSVLFGLCLWFVAGECLRLSKARFGDAGGLVAAVALTMALSFACRCYLLMNYGVLILAAFLLMNKALEKGHDVAAGLCWAVMMVKPQVGVLFFWPLFWHRRYWTIVTATAVCLGATFATSLVLHESVVDLLLQVPLIGKPYEGFSAARFLRPVLGEGAMLFVMPVFFALTGWLTGLVRKRRDFVFSCVPVVALVPVWTYCLPYDYVILLPLFVFLAGMSFAGKDRFGRALLALGGVCVALLVFSDVLAVGSFVGAFRLNDPGKIWRLALRLLQLTTLAALPLVMWRGREERA